MDTSFHSDIPIALNGGCIALDCLGLHVRGIWRRWWFSHNDETVGKLAVRGWHGTPMRPWRFGAVPTLPSWTWVLGSRACRRAGVAHGFQVGKNGDRQGGISTCQMMLFPSLGTAMVFPKDPPRISTLNLSWLLLAHVNFQRNKEY